jgi:hypothetical protein
LAAGLALAQAGDAAEDAPAPDPVAAEAASEGAAAEPLTGDALAAEVKRLVRQLDGKELAERQAAEEQLAALGPAALDLLPEITNRTTAETRERLGRIRDKLERAQAAAVAQPRRVTLTVEDKPLSEVLAEIEKQTGNAFIDYRDQMQQPARDPSISVSLDYVALLV